MTNQLQQGMFAPTFRTVDHSGNPISFDDYRGRKVLLTFMRYSACALCNLRVHHFIKRFPDWQRQGMDVIAFFESPEANIRAYVGTQNAPFPLVADPKAELYDLYGVETSEEKVRITMADVNTKMFAEAAAAAGFALTPEEGSNFNRIPADFLIDENGIIQLAHYSRMITDHLPLEEIECFAAGE
ncbi:redoxin domain-containing protein [Paenibacillus sp. LMG 31461]|uniref:Redoxin domain-containing protein n=1 Tax=Paenibacillus plantarum TaxID=2654975 RepID=A0ABX1XKN4_9BACL|nr:redoxin domain-containing protein [Paenibacillus plantarum]NOU68844.1 redoxin domain-containing protein [Paenibacillus plantarum]